MSSSPLKKCPSCKKSKLERLIGTGAGVIFKGSGFYQTDYRGDAYKNDAKNDTEAASKPSSDSKPSGDWGQVIIAEVNVGQSDQYL